MKNKYILCVTTANYITVKADNEDEVRKMGNKIFGDQKIDFAPENVKVLDTMVLPQ